MNRFFESDRRRAASMPRAPAPMQAALDSPGAPLDSASLAAMEAGFGRDFSRVRVHTDRAAGASAQAAGAAAFASGDHIAFAPGRFAPGTAAGLGLLAHELAHVVQQSTPGRGWQAASATALESEAESAALALARGGRAPALSSAAPGVQCRIELRDVGQGEQSGFARRGELVQRLNDLNCGVTFTLAADGELQAVANPGATPTEFGNQMIAFAGSAAVLPFRLTNRHGLMGDRATGFHDPVNIDSWMSGYVDIDDLLAASDLGLQIEMVHVLRERAATGNYERRIGSPSLDESQPGPGAEFDRAHARGLEAELLVLRDFFHDPTIRVIDPLRRVYRNGRRDTIRARQTPGRGEAGRGINALTYEVVTRADRQVHTPEAYLALIAAEEAEAAAAAAAAAPAAPARVPIGPMP